MSHDEQEDLIFLTSTDCTAVLKEETDRFEEMMALKAEVIAKFQHELLVNKYEVGIKLKKKM